MRIVLCLEGAAEFVRGHEALASQERRNSNHVELEQTRTNSNKLEQTRTNSNKLEHPKKRGERSPKRYELRGMVEVDRTRTNCDTKFRDGAMTAEKKKTKSPRADASRLAWKESRDPKSIELRRTRTNSNELEQTRTNSNRVRKCFETPVN